MQGATAKAVTGTPTKASPAVSKAKAAAVKASSSSPAKASPKKAKSTKRTPTKKKAGSARARDADEASSEPNAEPGTAEHGEEELEEEDSEDLEEEELSNEQIDKAVRLKLAEDEANKPSAALSCDMISATHHVSSSAAVSPEEVCARLTHVRLDRLRLASCPEPVLSTLHSVTHLYLQHNRLESIEAIGCLTTLKFLTVASNRLRQVSESALPVPLPHTNLSLSVGQAHRLAAARAASAPGDNLLRDCSRVHAFAPLHSRGRSLAAAFLRRNAGVRPAVAAGAPLPGRVAQQHREPAAQQPASQPEVLAGA